MNPRPTTPEGWCAQFRELDERFETEARSPLHHDNRCPVHTAILRQDDGSFQRVVLR